MATTERSEAPSKSLLIRAIYGKKATEKRLPKIRGYQWSTNINTTSEHHHRPP